MWRVVSYKNLDLRHTKVETSISKSIEFELSPSRQAYVLCLEGWLQVNEMMLEKHEATEIQPTSETLRLTFHGQTGEEQTHLLLYEMGKC